MTLLILQWKIKGYLNNYSELLLLIVKYSHKVISLQETHICTNKNIPIPVNYNMISNTSTNRFGGVALLVHKSIQHIQIYTNSDFETVAIEIDSLNKITIFSSYISPSTPFTYNN